MKKYQVRVVRDCTQVSFLHIEAEDEKGAEESAQDWLDNGNEVYWDLSDDSGEPYIPSEDSVEEL